jgi:glycosyltransferase involved in cell wall biosynthesis
VPKISVIIPVYNAAPYLQRCLDSVCRQTLYDIEIHCINDHSTDNSTSILHDYASNDKRIRIINLPSNKGDATARNTGIFAAQGEYLGFVDSDDTIDSDFYRNLYEKARKTNADIAEAQMRMIYSNGKCTIIRGYCWFCSSIFSKRFIHNNKIYFPQEIRYGPDGVFMCRALLAMPRKEYVEHTYYNYYQIETSIMHNISKAVCLSIITAYDVIFSDIITSIRDSKVNKEYGLYLCYYFLSAFIRLSKFHFPNNCKGYAARNLLEYYRLLSKHIDITSKFAIYEQKICDLLVSADIDGLTDYFFDSKKIFISKLRQQLKSKKSVQ